MYLYENCCQWRQFCSLECLNFTSAFISRLLEFEGKNMRLFLDDVALEHCLSEKGMEVREESHVALSFAKLTDVFSMSSFIATSRLVHNGGYIQKLLQLFHSPEILWFGRLYLITKFLLNLIDFTVFWLWYITTKFWNPPLWTSLWRLIKGSINSWMQNNAEYKKVSRIFYFMPLNIGGLNVTYFIEVKIFVLWTIKVRTIDSGGVSSFMYSSVSNSLPPLLMTYYFRTDEELI